MRLRSPKAKAWRLAARQLREYLWYWAGSSPAEVEEHLRDAVIPSLQRRAEIVERNTKRGVRVPR